LSSRRQRSAPPLAPQQPPQHCWPRTLQQVPQLLTRSHSPHHQSFPAGAQVEVMQPRPGPLWQIRQVAAQLRAVGRAMIAAAPKSERLRVKSSPSRALRTSSGYTHTAGIPPTAAVTISGFHRCPAGSHATTSPANPAFSATGPAHARISSMHHADPANIRRASTTES